MPDEPYRPEDQSWPNWRSRSQTQQPGAPSAETPKERYLTGEVPDHEAEELPGGNVGTEAPHPSDDMQESIETGHEVSDAGMRGPVIFLAVLVGLMALSFAVITVLQIVFSSGQTTITRASRPAGLLDDAPATIPAPVVARAIAGSAYIEYFSEQQRRLNSVGWVDQGAGTVHIPVEEAMRRVVQQGLPVQEVPEAVNRPQPPSYSSSGRVPISANPQGNSAANPGR